MGMYLTALRRWTNARVPFVCNDDWALRRIDQFHRALGRTIFITRRFNQANYVVIAPGLPMSNVGMRGGRQTCCYTANDNYSFFHELGHCLGLGHEYFHPGWPWRARLLGVCTCANYAQMRRCRHAPFDLHKIHKEAFLLHAPRYTSHLNWDPRSIMSYSPAGLGIARVPYVKPQAFSAADLALVKFLYPNAIP